MISVRQWGNLLASHPVSLASTIIVAARSILRNAWRRPDFPVGGKDPELQLWELRGNWVLEMLANPDSSGRIERFLAAQQKAETYPPDSYSASQRIANAIYLLRTIDFKERKTTAALLEPPLIRDALYLRENPEFRTLPTSFNNHLLNNYRAAVMVEAHRPLVPRMPDMTQFVRRTAEIIMRHHSTLFSHDGVLLEGSVSYELLILKHLVDIACTGAADPLGARAREWLPGEADRVRQTYRKNDRWLLPQIGDCSPDWNVETIENFLNGFVLGHDTSYRRVWRKELPAIGF